jgi:hypothetical protein
VPQAQWPERQIRAGKKSSTKPLRTGPIMSMSTTIWNR